MNDQALSDFEAARIVVQHWAAPLLDTNQRKRLVSDLVVVLSPAVLAHLPPSMHVAQNPDAVDEWITSRAAESDVYTVRDKKSAGLLGLLIVVCTQDDTNLTTLHIGYLLAETAWGRGYASELIKALLKQAQARAPILLSGGVGRDNPASARVLQKNGFKAAPREEDAETIVFENLLSL